MWIGGNNLFSVALILEERAAPVHELLQTVPLPPPILHKVLFEVQDSGFRVRVQDSGCRVQGAGFRVQSLGFRVQGAGSRVQGSGFRVQGLGFRVQKKLDL